MDKKQIGKKSRVEGKKFENAVRQDLMNKGWIVSKFTNNVEFPLKPIEEKLTDLTKDIHKGKAKIEFEPKEGKLVPAKSQYNPFFKRIVGEGSGFPDFVCWRKFRWGGDCTVVHALDMYEVWGIEAKINGKLDKSEKEKCKWLLDNHIFSKILIAKKIKVGRKIEVEYNEIKM